MPREKKRTVILLSLMILTIIVFFAILDIVALITSYPPYIGNPALDLTASSVIITNSAVASHTATAEAR